MNVNDCDPNPLSIMTSTSWPRLSCNQTRSPRPRGTRTLFEADVSLPPPMDTTDLPLSISETLKNDDVNQCDHMVE